MGRSFFDFTISDLTAPDDDGLELTDVEAAHDQALSALMEAARDAVLEGATGQTFAVEVRDEIGPVLEVTAVFGSKIFRKQ